MTLEIKVPVLPESVAEGTIATWYKKPGEFVKRDEHLVDIETDKVVLEVVAPADGSLEKILKEQGSTVQAEEVIASFKEGEGIAAGGKAAPAPTSAKPEAAAAKVETAKVSSAAEAPAKKSSEGEAALSPAIRRLLSEYDIDVSKIKGSGKGGQVTKEDALKAIDEFEEKSKEKEKQGNAKAAQPEKTEQAKVEAKPAASEAKPAQPSIAGERPEKRVPMTRLRARIAERLLAAQHNAALLTTFNEINMQHVIDLRKKYKDTFEHTYGIRLGFMSFFTLAVVEALKQFPMVNASIDGNDIVYHGYYDVGIAVSTERGLVVPILKDADTLTMAEIEKKIAELSNRARTGHLTMEDITGGTFSITNGGVFGSLLATPIINPPQTAILGMHKIQERPVAENGQVVIRPMMYVALSYDHRLIDGSEAIRFLVAIKELLEEPARLALGI